MNWTAPSGWTLFYGDYMSGQGAANGGEGVTGEGLRSTNGAVMSRFHYPLLEHSEL